MDDMLRRAAAPIQSRQTRETGATAACRVAAPKTYVREAGSGPAVVCIHANASSSGQWRGLMERLAPSFHVLAADSYGAGQGPAWARGRAIRLADEAELLEPVFARADAPFVLVGHSYGAAVALIAALANPGRVRALVLYEPTLFSLLDAETPAPNDADGIRCAVADAAAAVAAGDADAAAERFIDYWMGPGSWERTPPHRKPPILASIPCVGAWGRALFNEATRLHAFRSLDVPVVLMMGRRSTPSALGVARLLAAALPRVQKVSFEAMGHMGPVTHPEIVNMAIEAFLAKTLKGPYGPGPL